MEHKPKIAFRDLYPELSEEELQEAEANFVGYLEVVARIYDRISQDPEAYERLKDLLARRKTPGQKAED